MAGPSIEINHNRNKDVSLNDIINVARGAHVHVPKQTFMLLEDRRAHIEGYIRDTKQPAYGFNPHSPDEAAFFKRPRGNSGLRFSELWGIERGRDGGPGG